MLLRKHFSIRINPPFSVPRRNLQNTAILLHHIVARVWREWVQQLLWRLPRKIEYLPSSHFLEDDEKQFRKVYRNASQRCYRLLQQYPRFKKRYTVQFSGDDRLSLFELSKKRTNSVRTIEELLVKSVPQTFKRYFQNFLLKANQQLQFVEIVTITYIFQSHSIYNISGKVVQSITKHYDRYKLTAAYWYVNKSQLYAANQHLFLFRFR